MTIAELEAQRAALDASAPTREEVDAHDARRADLDRRVGAARTAQATLDALVTNDDDAKWLAFLTTARATCAAERMAIKSPIRDREVKYRAEVLEQSIRLIDRGLGGALGIDDLTPLPIGEMMIAAGREVTTPALHGPRGWRGSLPAVEKRLTQRAAEERAARAALADALLDDDQRAQRDAEAAAYREGYNRLNLRHSHDATTLVAYRDGRVLPVNEMTDAEREVFERANRAFAES
jgi:hypothetical protein